MDDHFFVIRVAEYPEDSGDKDFAHFENALCEFLNEWAEDFTVRKVEL